MDSNSQSLSSLSPFLPFLLHLRLHLLLHPFPLAFLFLLVSSTLLLYWSSPGGHAWGLLPTKNSIPGPRGWPLLGSLLHLGSLAHVRLAHLASLHSACSLMAFSLGNTRVILTCVPDVAHQILTSPAFGDRPLKQSAKQLMFDRAIGFAPYGDHWRRLRRIAATYLFSPKRITAHEPHRQYETSKMLQGIAMSMTLNGIVPLRTFLQRASLNNIMKTVFGRQYNFESGCEEAEHLQRLVREGFDLLGAFNWGDHLPLFQFMDSQKIHQRCSKLASEVRVFVQKIIDDHRQMIEAERTSDSDFVDVLLTLQRAEKLSDRDIIAVLWEMIFRGTDTTVLVVEWMLAEVILQPEVQRRLHQELDSVVGSSRTVTESDIALLPYLQAVIKETFRMHPPGPLLSWARLAVHDVNVNGHHVPAGTTAMVNMWAITHDPLIWSEPEKFKPQRFLPTEGGSDVDIRGNDLRLAPFGAGRRVCPGRAFGLTTVQLWAARLFHHFEWYGWDKYPVNLREALKLSCEMECPLVARAIRRIPLDFQTTFD